MKLLRNEPEWDFQNTEQTCCCHLTVVSTINNIFLSLLVEILQKYWRCWVCMEFTAPVGQNRLTLFCSFADRRCCNGRPVRVPQQSPARRRSGRHWGSQAECRQVWVAQEARRVCQDLAQSLVCSARGSALLLQRRGGDQSPGKAANGLRDLHTDSSNDGVTRRSDFTD